MKATSRTQTNLRLGTETRRLLDMASACEARPLAEIVDDAVALYIRSRSSGYRQYFEAARRYCDAQDGSEEQALALDELVQGIAKETGETVAAHGGTVAAVRARLRQRNLGQPVVPAE